MVFRSRRWIVTEDEDGKQLEKEQMLLELTFEGNGEKIVDGETGEETSTQVGTITATRRFERVQKKSK